ncbi:MAG: hypothetical protein AAGA06_08025 [Pseudomonadota bacterium]
MQTTINETVVPVFDGRAVHVSHTSGSDALGVYFVAGRCGTHGGPLRQDRNTLGEPIFAIDDAALGTEGIVDFWTSETDRCDARHHRADLEAEDARMILLVASDKLHTDMFASVRSVGGEVLE